ncbi:MAG: LLM class flavin-dependent oxidoreductase, partial [Actinomycetia bacterium]|nr:LLM class flavin-dependent oxidoreductase [Actinomycetes bacterium]
MRIAVEVWGADLPTITRTARLADQLGIDGFYYGESPGPLNLDSWTTLAHLAGVTEQIRLGPVITNALPAYRSTALLAKQAATVALISNGRLDYRTGVGASRRYASPWWEPFGVEYAHYTDRLEDLRTTLTELRTLWQGPEGRGRLELDHPAIPITVAATGERAIALAHEVADQWEVSFRTAGELKSLVDSHECHGDPCQLPISLEIDGFLGSSPGRVDSLLASVATDRSTESFDELRKRALVGTVPQVVETIGGLQAAGAQQLVVALHDPHDIGALETLAEAAVI